MMKKIIFDNFSYNKWKELLKIAKSMGFVHMMTCSLSEEEKKQVCQDIDEHKEYVNQRNNEIEADKQKVISLCKSYLSLITDDETNNLELKKNFFYQYRWQHSTPFHIIHRTIGWYNKVPDESNRFYTKKEYAYKFLELWVQMPINEAETQWIEWVDEQTKQYSKI